MGIYSVRTIGRNEKKDPCFRARLSASVNRPMRRAELSQHGHWCSNHTHQTLTPLPPLDHTHRATSLQVALGQPDFGPQNNGSDPGLITLRRWSTPRRVKCGGRISVLATIFMYVRVSIVPPCALWKVTWGCTHSDGAHICHTPPHHKPHHASSDRWGDNKCVRYRAKSLSRSSTHAPNANLTHNHPYILNHQPTQGVLLCGTYGASYRPCQPTLPKGATSPFLPIHPGSRSTVSPSTFISQQFKNLDISTATTKLDIPDKPQGRTAQKTPPMVVRFKHYNTRKVRTWVIYMSVK